MSVDYDVAAFFGLSLYGAAPITINSVFTTHDNL